jgi:hypothetical protein
MTSEGREPRAPVEELKARVFEAIDESFKEVLGETGRKVIYYYFQERTGLQAKDVAERPEALVALLRDIFKAGAEIFEKRIMEKLCAKFGVDLGKVGGTDVAALIKRLVAER